MSAQSYKVVEVKGTNDWNSSKGGSMTDYRCVFEGVDGDVEVTRKQTSPPVEAGADLFGTLEPKGQAGYTYKFRAQQQGGGFSGPRPEDPKRAKRIVRQHSQDMALQYASIRQAQGKLPDTFSLDDLFKIADKFDEDAEAAAA